MHKGGSGRGMSKDQSKEIEKEWGQGERVRMGVVGTNKDWSRRMSKVNKQRKRVRMGVGGNE